MATVQIIWGYWLICPSIKFPKNIYEERKKHFPQILNDETELRAFFLSPLLPFSFYSMPLFLRGREIFTKNTRSSV